MPSSYASNQIETMKSLTSPLVAALIALPLVSSAANFGPGPVPAAATSFRIGAIAVTSLSDTEYVLPNDGKIFGVGVGPEAVAQVLSAGNAPPGVISLPVDALLVRDGQRTILIDSGLGPKLGGALMASLALIGVKPTDVTDVLITHPHPDHIGGLMTAEGHPAFPGARIRLSAPDWKQLSAQADQASLVTAIKAQVESFEPGASITPSVTSVPLPGHTPGHVGYRISSGGDSILDVGDVAHSSIISLAQPDWGMGFDQDGTLAKSTRRHALADLAKSRQLIFAPHFPDPGIGTVEASGDGFRWIAATLPRSH
jgi:glyoxylase-like metal-dependent hydrolase (beta-lactamase superfamily II)